MPSGGGRSDERLCATALKTMPALITNAARAREEEEEEQGQKKEASAQEEQEVVVEELVQDANAPLDSSLATKGSSMFVEHLEDGPPALEDLEVRVCAPKGLGDPWGDDLESLEQGWCERLR